MSTFQPINPKPFLKTLLNKSVVVRLKWNKLSYRGVLVAIDNYMNLQLEDTTEIVGDKAGGEAKSGEEKIGDIFIRCNNVLYVREASVEGSAEGSAEGLTEGSGDTMNEA